MKYTSEKTGNTLSVKFTITNEEMEAHTAKAYEQNKGKYNVAGFRKGHVPRKVLENLYGKDLFFEDALYLAASEYYGQYLDKNKEVYPVSRPVLKDSKTTEKGVAFTVEVVVKPEFTLGQYKGLTIEKTKPEAVKAADVDEELERVRQRNARFVEITDRPVADGDEVDLDYSGSVNGEKFEGGTAEGQSLVIGSHTFIEGFEPQLIGMAVGEEKDISVTFPENYHAEDLAGKDAIFHVKINSIRFKELPTLDDDFAKDVSEFETLKDYKADIKKQLKADREKAAAEKDESRLLDAVVDATPVDIPKEMIEEQIDSYVDDFEYQLRYQGMNIADYYKYTESTPDQLRENYRARAEKAVHTRLIFEQIVKAEKLKADKKSVSAKIAEYAKEIGEDAATFEEKLTEDQRYYFENQVVTQKLIDLLKKENTIA